MILVDTAIWIDHFRRGNAALFELLDAGQVLIHPFVVGELMLGSPRPSNAILKLLQNLPEAPRATDQEIFTFVDAHSLSGRGIGFVDAHLLAAVSLAADATLWTRDKRLLAAARQLSLAADF